MTCANCAGTIERRLKKVEGVVEATVNLASEKASVSYTAGVVTPADRLLPCRSSFSAWPAT